MNLRIFQKMIVTIIYLVKLVKKHTNKDQSFGEILNDVREKNISQPIIRQFKINSITNKFHFLESEPSKHLGILVVSETKIDKPFPSAQFFLF